MENNTYRVFAFSQDVIDIYSKSEKKAMKKIANNSTPRFDTIIVFFNYNTKSTLELKFFKNGQELYSNYIHSYDYDNYPDFDFSIELAGTTQPEQKEESLFCVGDRVFNWSYGWCKITGFTNISIFFELEKNNKVKEISIDSALKQFSFTEYNFIDGGWSQERPKPLPKVGDIGYFWDDDDLEQKKILYGELKNIDLSHKSQRYYAEDIWLKYFSTEKPF